MACTGAALLVMAICIGCGGKGTASLSALSTDTSAQSSPKLSQASGDKPVSVPDAFPKEGGAPLYVHFWDGDSYDPDGQIVKWEWNFGDGGWQDCTGTEGDTWHQYQGPGNRVALLRVTDNDGNRDVGQVMIEMRAGSNANPVALAAAEPAEGEAPLDVALAAAGSYDPDGDIVKWEWCFGETEDYLDCTADKGRVDHQYTAAGEYTAVLRVTDDDGAQSSDTATITVTEPVIEAWMHTWGGGGSDSVTAVATGSDGSVYSTGTTNSFGAGSWDACLLKYSSAGSLIWKRAWGGSSYDYSYAVAVDSQDRIYVAGTTYSFVTGFDANAFLLCFDSDGTLQWQRTWGGLSNEYVYGLDIDGANNIFVAGYTQSFGAGSADTFLLCFDQNGDLQWQRTWGGGSNDFAFAVATDNLGNIYEVGRTWSFGEGYYDSLLLCYDQTGSLRWQRIWGTADIEDSRAVAADGAGNVRVAGQTSKSGVAVYDAYVLGYSSSGDLQWRRTWSANEMDVCAGVTIDASGSTFATGFTYGSPNASAYVIEFDPSGTLVAAQTLIHPEYSCSSVSLCSGGFAGAVILGGQAYNVAGASWQAIDGTVGEPVGVSSEPAGTESEPAGNVSTPDGTVTETFGVEDTGGGNYDGLTGKRIFPVTNQAPEAVLAVTPMSGDAPLTVTFDATGSYDPDGSIYSYSWDFDGDGTFGEPGPEAAEQGNPSPDYAYTQGGIYDATLRVVDNWGRTDEVTVPITVNGSWVHTWGGTASDSTYAVAADSQGNIYTAGSTQSFGTGSYDVILLKYNSFGQLLWQRTLGAGAVEYANGIATDSLGNVYVTGSTNSFGAGANDVFLASYSGNGDLRWQRTWGGSSWDSSYAVAVSGPGDIYVAGNTSSYGAGGNDAFLLKFGSDGSLLWQRTWGGTGSDSAVAVITDNAGNIYITGSSSSFSNGYSDVILLSYDSNGSLQWQRTAGGSAFDGGYGLVVDTLGNIYVAAQTYGIGAGSYDALLLCYSNDGNLQWQRTWGGTNYDLAYDVTWSHATGEIYVIGYSYSFGNTRLTKLALNASSGSLVGAEAWVHPSYSLGYYQCAAIAPDGSLLFSGYAPSITGASWQPVNGTFGTPALITGAPSGISKTPTGAVSTPTAVETTPVGVEDTGGGGSDCLVGRLLVE